MKILYISHQKENSGYGQSCRWYLQALKETGFEISSYPIILGKPGDFKDDTEYNKITDCDIVINHTLPHYWSYNGQFDKNIGILLKETDNIEFTDWQQYIDMMDQIWIPNNANNKYITIPQPIDINRYTKNIPTMNIDETRGTYVFYTICEATKRKNLSGLITAYYQAFNYSDPVSLILKVNKSGYSTEQVEREVQDLIDKIAGGCRLYQDKMDYPRVFVIGQNWNDDQILALHKFGDCYVCDSYGESINLSMLDAIGLNKNVITSYNDSCYYQKFGRINIIQSFFESCYGNIDAFPGHVTSREIWRAADPTNFSVKMREIYETRPKTENDLSLLSFKNIARLMVEQLT